MSVVARAAKPREARGDPSVIPVRVGLYVAALCTALIVGPRGPVYWDSFGYVRDALTVHLSGLGAGRPWFSFVGAMVLRAAFALGAPIWSAEPVLRMFWMVVAALAAPAVHALARACGLASRASLLAAIAMAFSPAMAHTSRAVLSDAPSVAVSLLALLACIEASRAEGLARRVVASVLAGVLLAFAIGLREQSAYVLVSFAWLVLIARANRWSVGLAVALSFVVALALTMWLAFVLEPHLLEHIASWREAMRLERAQHQYGARDLARYATWLVALGPATSLAAFAAWFRERDALWSRDTPLAAVCVPALAQLAMLAAYQDIAYSPRYLLPALAGAIAIPAALTFDRWLDARERAVSVVLALLIAPAAIAAPVLRHRERPLREILDSLPARLANVPRDAIVVTGQPCPAVLLQRTLHRLHDAQRPDWQPVCPGWSWPADLDTYLERERGVRTVVLDVRPDAWLGNGQRSSLAEVVRYVGRHADREARGEIIVWR